MKKVTVKWNRRLESGHLWVFANEVVSSFSQYEKGEIVRIYDQKGRFRATGYINPNSLITIRILSREDEEINREFFVNKIRRANDYRASIGYKKFDSYRLIYGESDGLPGLVIDKYRNYFSVQLLTAGMERLFTFVKFALLELFSVDGIVLRNDTSMRELEGLPQYKEVVYGNIEDRVAISEDGIFYKLDLLEGQKTGFFLDQRINRIYLRKLVEKDKIIRALDCFSYSGGWALNAVYNRTNVDITAVDISEKACILIRENAALNKKNINVLKTDVFDFLRTKLREGDRYDLIILDPPAFIKSRTKIKEGVRGYKEINLTAMKLLGPGGILVTASCSHHLSRDNFIQLLRDAATDSGRQFRIIKMSGQSEDHPFLLSMPETEYLKTFFLKLY